MPCPERVDMPRVPQISIHVNDFVRESSGGTQEVQTSIEFHLGEARKPEIDG